MHQGPLLPVEPIRNTINGWLERNNYTQNDLSVRTGISERGVFRLLSGESKKITWEIADILITRTVGPLHWHTEPELREVYLAFDFARHDLVKPLDNPVARAYADKVILKTWDESRTRGEAGGKLRMNIESFTKILDPALRRAGRPLTKSAREPRTHCHKGHEIAVVGRMKDGQCVACRDEYNESRRISGRGINHGSAAGYRRCRQRDEGSCQPCKDAWNEYITARSRSKKKVAA